MLSRQSIKCLLEIAASPKFGGFVRRVVIGPERISSHLAEDIRTDAFVLTFGGYSPILDDEYQKMKHRELYQAFYTKWHALVQDQKAFDVECVAHLERVFRSLANLQQVQLDPYATEEDFWKDTWGARSLVRELGLIPARLGATSTLSWKIRAVTARAYQGILKLCYKR